MKLGQWVEVDNKIGYIVFKNRLETSIKVKFGSKNSKVYTKEQLRLSSAKLNKEDIHSLQLLALETNDKDWFVKLGKLKTNA